MKKITLEEAMNMLVDVIANKRRHDNYDRTVKMSEKLTKLVTGEDMDDLMKRFDQRESTDQFSQRKRITQHITKTVCQNLKKPARKIPRSNSIQRIIAYMNDSEGEKVRELEKILGKFWGDKSMDNYLNKRWIDLNYTDPNAFIVVEWKPFDGNYELASPYPYEVDSRSAIYYEYENNVLSYLITKNYVQRSIGSQHRLLGNEDEPDSEVPRRLSPEKRERYTMYLSDRVVVLDKLTDNEVKQLMMPVPTTFLGAGQEYIDISGNVYMITLPSEHNLGFVPAFRVGYELDEYTKAKTCVSPIDEAVPILMKLVKANSELDLTMALHTFPQKIQYTKRCGAKDCNDGKLPDGSTCTSCKGKGLEVQKSAQEIIEIAMPKDPQDIISLENVIHYEHPEVSLVKFQDEYIKSLTAQCKEAVYNSDIYSRKEVAETATGKNIDLQNVYDALYDMAQAYAKSWVFLVEAIAKITDKDKELIADFKFSKDFKMKSLSDLYADLKMVQDSRADSFVVQGIYDDIARLMYSDDPQAYLRYKTKEAFYPFTGKDTGEVMFIISGLPRTDFNRVLWESYGWIFSELEREHSRKGNNFYEYERSRQWSIIEKKVKKIIAEMEKQLELNPELLETGREED